MAHEFSQSAVRASGPRYRPVASEPPVPLVRYPDAFDARYPRRWALRALRFAVGLWWLPLVAYLSQAAATLVRHALAHGPRSLANAHLALAALRTSWAPALAAQRPAGLTLLAAAALAVAVALAGGWRLGRWALADRVREAQVLVMRLARPEERTNPAWMRRALLPAMEWRLRQHRARRRLAALALFALAVGAGVALALVVAPVAPGA